MAASVGRSGLQARVRSVYEGSPTEPDAESHFETGRALAERLGHPAAAQDAVPPAAVASFAGIGHFLDLAGIRPGDTVLDLGSGSATDSFTAATGRDRPGWPGDRCGQDQDPTGQGAAAPWAACVGGAAQRDDRLRLIRAAGFEIDTVRDNDYRFRSDRASSATARYRVRGISVLAHRHPGVRS